MSTTANRILNFLLIPYIACFLMLIVLTWTRSEMLSSAMAAYLPGIVVVCGLSRVFVRIYFGRHNRQAVGDALWMEGLILGVLLVVTVFIIFCLKTTLVPDPPQRFRGVLT